MIAAALAVFLQVAPAVALPPPPPPRERAVEPAGPVLLVLPRLLMQMDGVPRASKHADPDLGDPVAFAGFRMRRLRAGFDARVGAFAARTDFELWAEGDVGQAAPGVGAGRGAGPRVRAAFVGYAPDKTFTLQAGSLRVPFSLSRQVDEGDLRLPERPLSVASMAPDFRVGAAARGDLNLLRYTFGVYNADELGTAGALLARGYLYAARLEVEPLGPVGHASWLRPSSDPWWGWWRVAAGVSAFYEDAFGENNYGVGGDAQFQWRRFTVTGEVLWVRRGPQRLGFVIEPGVFVVLDRLEVVLRGEAFDDAYNLPSPYDAWSAAAGLNWLPVTGAGRIKVQAVWGARRGRLDEVTADHAIVRLGLSL